MRQKGFIPILLLLIIGILIFGGAFYYLKYQKVEESLNTNGTITLPNSNTDGGIPPLSPSVSKAKWKQYSDDTYTFQHPEDWRIESATASEKEYWGGKSSVVITAPSSRVSIRITPGIFPYGFSENNQREGETLQILIEKKQYSVIEKVRTENGVTKTFSDLKVAKPQTEYHILFGTGYPATNDDTVSSSDYILYRDTILQILSTLMILKP